MIQGADTPQHTEDPAEQFARRWEDGSCPTLGGFLAQAGNLTPSQLAAVLRVDQRRRWEAGERVPAELYLGRHLAVRADPECALELIYAEYLLREERRESPTLAEYLERFPEHTARLREQIGLHQALGAASSSGDDIRSLSPDTLRTAALTPTAPHLGAWPELPGYEIFAELGRGGMGVVYQAWQSKLRRVVALKVILAGDQAGPEQLARFHTEAEAAARLQHPSIVQVYEIGDHQGRSYFTMEYVDGGSLAQHLRAGPLSAATAAHLAELLAGAMDYAHQRGILHRDLKPANVLLVSVARVPSSVATEKKLSRIDSGQRTTDNRLVPKITDFGLAKLTSGGDGVTRSGALLGTPRYMAPEQAAGGVRDVGPPADVYSLGVILYEMLTGRPPFQGQTVADTLHQVLTLEPVPPRRLQPKLPRDLETICLKCLEKEPAQRYPSAQALADDLARFREGKPITARPAGRLERLVKWARRRPALAGLWAVSLLAVLTAAGVATWLGWNRAERRTATTRGVEQALAEVARLRSAAAAEDRDSWGRVLAAARRAEALLEQGEAESALQDRVRALLEELEREDRARQMAERLEEIRLGLAEFVEGHPDRAGVDAGYRAAFQEYDIPVEELTPEEAAGRIRAVPGNGRLLAALDNWALTQKLLGKPGWQHLLESARLADTDPWRGRLRDLLRRQDQNALKALVKETKIEELPPATVVFLAQALFNNGEQILAVMLLRQGQEQHSEDFWLNFSLAEYFGSSQPPRNDEAVRFYTAAVALRSHSALPRYNLGGALAAQGRYEEAAAAFRQALRLKPDIARMHTSLADMLCRLGRLDEAVPALRAAVRLEPKNELDHDSLGRVLGKLGHVEEAIACYREAIRLKPDYARAHADLGNTLASQGRLDEAVAVFREAIRLDPKDASICNDWGNVLYNQGQFEEAVAAYHKAISFQPGDARYHYNLGLALAKLGRSEEAIAAYRKAIHLLPTHAGAHNNLGLVYVGLGRLDEAIAELREALRLKPDEAMYHISLGKTLEWSGRFAEALAALQRGQELRSRTTGPQMHETTWMKQCRRWQELETQLPDLLTGKLTPRDAAEKATFARLCLMKGHNAAAARLFQQGFTERPSLAEDLADGVTLRFLAARAAALAGDEHGKDASQLTADERQAWRQQALQWLRAVLRKRAAAFETSASSDRSGLRWTLNQWRGDIAFAGIREPSHVAALPQPEQEECRQFWASVDALLACIGS